MKKVVLIVPDKINRTIGASQWSKTDEINLTPENLLMVLRENSKDSVYINRKS